MAEDGGGGLIVQDTAEAVIRRPIIALEFENLRPSEPPTGAPSFLWVDPRTLLVDETYQRTLSVRSLRMIRRIAEGWDWAKFKPPIVANTVGGLEVIDGQHTAIAAATHGGIENIPVMVVGAAAVKDRARSFVAHNRDRLGMTPAQIHYAGLAAGDVDALAVQKVVDAAGATLLLWPPSGGVFKARECIAYTYLYRLVVNRGPARATAALRIVAEAEAAPIHEFQLRAVEFLLSEPEYQGHVTGPEITRALIALGADLKPQATLFAAEHRVRLWRGAAVVLFRRITHGKRKIA